MRFAPESRTAFVERYNHRRYHESLGNLDSGEKRNGLSEAYFHVFAKLSEDGLERGLEAEAFSWG